VVVDDGFHFYVNKTFEEVFMEEKEVNYLINEVGAVPSLLYAK